MNDLEAWFELRLGFLIEPQWPQNALVLIEELKPERNKLAHWLMKTAVTFSHTTLETNHPVQFPYAVTKKIKDGISPENCWVDLAYSKSAAVSAAITRQFYVINGNQPIQNFLLENGYGFHFVFQLNHLLLRIAQAPQVGEFIYGNQSGELPIRLYPTPAAQTPENFAYEDIVHFHQSIILKTWEGCRGNIH